MPPQAQAQVPAEILDHIFSFLQDDHSSLRCCAEVNTVFSDNVERHLYQQVTLTNVKGLRGIDELMPAELMKLFTLTPRLASHVRVLCIVIAPTVYIERFSKDSKDNNAIGEILRLFFQINTLVLDADEHMVWNSFDQTFRQSFIQLLLQPSVENISIGGLAGFPLYLFDQCTSLKYLALSRIRYLGSSTPSVSDLPTESRSKHRAQQMSLEIGGSELEDVLPWLFPKKYAPRHHISSLRIAVRRSRDIRPLQAFLNDHSRQLKEVHLLANSIALTVYNIAHEIIFPPTSAPHEVPNFSTTPSLKSLAISGVIASLDNGNRVGRYCRNEDAILATCIPWFIQVLQTFDSCDAPNNLDHIVLEIIFVINEVTLTKLNWEPLITVLRSRQFSSLRRVELRVIHRHEPSTIDFQTLISGLHSDVHLSWLAQSGLLSITGHSRVVNS